VVACGVGTGVGGGVGATVGAGVGGGVGRAVATGGGGVGCETAGALVADWLGVAAVVGCAADVCAGRLAGAVAPAEPAVPGACLGLVVRTGFAVAVVAAVGAHLAEPDPLPVPAPVAVDPAAGMAGVGDPGLLFARAAGVAPGATAVGWTVAPAFEAIPATGAGDAPPRASTCALSVAMSCWSEAIAALIWSPPALADVGAEAAWRYDTPASPTA
jgi:hypothetical protein